MNKYIDSSTSSRPTCCWSMCKIGQNSSKHYLFYAGWCLAGSCGGEWVQWEPSRRNSMMRKSIKKERKMGKTVGRQGRGKEGRKVGCIREVSGLPLNIRNFQQTDGSPPSQLLVRGVPRVPETDCLRVPATGWEQPTQPMGSVGSEHACGEISESCSGGP